MSLDPKILMRARRSLWEFRIEEPVAEILIQGREAIDKKRSVGCPVVGTVRLSDEVASVSVETNYPAAQQVPASSEVGVTLIVISCAILLGASAGILIAERDGHVGERTTVAEPSANRLTVQPASSALAAGKASASAPGGAKAAAHAVISAGKTRRSGTPSIGAINCSEAGDSTIVDIELGSAVLIRTEQIDNPQRIYFDFRDSQRTQGSMEALKARKAVRSDGTLIAGIRVSEFESGAIRAVLDLKRPCQYKYNLSSEPSPRLTVTVW